MDREDVIRIAKRAGIVFRLTSADVTVEKLERFLELADGYKTRGWRIKESEARKVTDVSRFARETKPDPKNFDPCIFREEKEDYIPYGSRGWLWFWLRSEGGAIRRGINLTIIDKNNPSGCYRGFVLILKTKKHKYRFRFRTGIKPMFLWSKE
jgi:hypothetical protein